MSRALPLAGFVALLAGVATGPAQAARETVLKQVDLPHNYYWRELYIPQLTTGPSSVAFLPDGQSVVFSMGGSLWRQVRGGAPPAADAEAIELTHANGAYDYQPDVSPDGRIVVFARYDGNAMELWRLDLASGREQPLTTNGGVNLEPRLSPDGTQLAWVSTAGTGHFNLVIAPIGETGLGAPRPLFEPRESHIDRYYYSRFDHAINPSWSPDGERVYFVSNPEIAWGTGDIWSISVRGAPDLRKVLSEETSWSARPEVSPDGNRVLFASYHGRDWHQLWLTTPKGAAPLPLTFGDFDRRNARWSADGQRIAYVSNEHGNTELVVQEVIGGAQTKISTQSRKYRLSQARLTLDIHDAKGERVPARVSVLASDGRAYAPDQAWMQADDGFDRAVQRTETHYFHCAPPCSLAVPAGEVAITVQHGFAHLPWKQKVTLAAAGADTGAAGAPVADAAAAREIDVRLEGHALPASFGRWLSADLHMHMNYGGHYKNTPQGLAFQAQAEDLDVVHDLVVNKEERIPQIERFSATPDPAGGEHVVLLHSQEFHSSFWGHLGLLFLEDHLLTPDFASYRHTAFASPYPHNGVIADLAHAQNGLVGHAHPFDADVVPAKERSLSNSLPAEAVLGKIDYLEVTGFSDHEATAGVWYRLLNTGARIPAGGGSDTMSNYASLHGPVGLTRTFLDTRGERTVAALREALKAGRTFASNAPLLGLEMAELRPGDTLSRRAPGNVPYRVAMRSPVPIDHVELVHNGKVIESFALHGDRRSLDVTGSVRLDRGGWVLLRAWNDGADPLVFDGYPYGTTSPIYLDLPGKPATAGEDATYFVAWLDRVIQTVSARDDFNDARERKATLDYLNAARDRYVELQKTVGSHPK